MFPPKAAGLGLEPRYPGPKPGVLPLDDPAALNINNQPTHSHCRESAESRLCLPLDDPGQRGEFISYIVQRIFPAYTCAIYETGLLLVVEQ